MDVIDLLAASGEDIGGIIGFCVFAAFVVFVILAKAISSVSPEAMARKIRELQGQREGGKTFPAGYVKPVPAAYQKPLPARYEEPVYAELAVPATTEAPKKKRKKKRLERVSEGDASHRLVSDVRSAKKAAAEAPAAAPAEGAPSLRQAVIYAELLAPPLALRRGRGRGLLRSAPWIR